MKEFIINYGGTIAVAVVIAVVLFFAIRKIVKDKKSRKSGCSCGCENCSYSKSCKK